jgi:hypothetical protein
MAGMGLISRAIEMLPAWANVILVIIGIAASIYGITHYGFWHFMLRMIFSPDL